MTEPSDGDPTVDLSSPGGARDADRDGRLEEILRRYLKAVDEGRPVNRQRLIEQHPDLAEDLRAFFAEQDAAEAVMGTAVVPLPGPASPARPPRVSRYDLQEELGRGGMGAVLKGRDTDLGRDVAVKVLLEERRDKADLALRFVEEAQIAGQLQHPGVVPVYELGRFPDRRPFFAMKLVKGQTLAALLAARKGPEEDRVRFVGVFAQVCQAMAYPTTGG
jgi:hypothetical protein